MTYQYENDKYGLVPFTEWMIDESNYQSWFHDREVTKYNSHGLFPYTKEKVKSFLNNINNEHNVTYAIYKKRDTNSVYNSDKHIGNVSLQSINWINRSAELAIVLGEERNKGLGTQVCSLMLYHAFVKLGLHRVWSGTSEHNEGMSKVFNKINMSHEGTFRDGMWSNGMFVDIYVHSILINEFENSRIILNLLEQRWKI